MQSRMWRVNAEQPQAQSDKKDDLPTSARVMNHGENWDRPDGTKLNLQIMSNEDFRRILGISEPK